MKIALFIIGLLSLATLTNAGTFLEAKHRASMGTNTLSAETFVKNLKQTDFGKSILNLLSLQFKTSGKLDDVNQLIKSLQSNLNDQQNDETQKYQATTANNNQVVQNQNNIIISANDAIQSDQRQLSDANSQLNQLQITQQNLIQERDGINALIQERTARREVEAAAFAKRVEDQQLLITGIQKTVVLFQQSVSGGQFNSEDVAKLLELLQSLEAAFVASIAQDQQQEAQAIQDFQDLLVEKNNRLAEIADLLQSLAVEITNLQTRIGQLNDDITAQTTARDNAQVLRDQTIQSQKALDERYNSNQAVRADQLRLLANAVVVLNGNSADVQSYLNQA